MAQVKNPLPVLPFCAITFKKENVLPETQDFLIEKISPILMRSEILNFSDFTSYYEKEMGNDLKKIFLIFNNVISPDNFHVIKKSTNEFEKQHLDSSGNNRQINLDPGYITEAKFVLYSAKDFSHRIYVKDGIFAEVQLVFRGNSFQPLPWSYPDYSRKESIDFINQGRNILREKLGKK